MVPLLADEREASALVDAARRGEAILGPQHDAAVARGAGEGHRLADKPLSDAEAARPWLDIEHAQLRHAWIVDFRQDEDRASHRSVAFGDPKPFRRRLGRLGELGIDAGDQRLEFAVPPLFFVIEQALAIYEPAELADAMVAQHQGVNRLARQEAADDCHGRRQRLPLGRSQRLYQGEGGGVAQLVESRRGGIALRRQDENAGPPVFGAGPHDQKPFVDEPGRQPAQLAGVHAKQARQGGRGQAIELADFVDNPRLAEREWALEDAFVEQPDHRGIETIEGADGGDLVGGFGHGGWRSNSLTISNIRLTESTKSRAQSPI